MSKRSPGLDAAVSVVNGIGRISDRIGLKPVSLEPESLIAAAQRRAGSDSFGEWDFRASFEQLIHAYQGEANLTLLGRITVRELLVSLLANLLQMERERSENPSISSQPVAAPLFIIGLPRTGTTLLHGLLAQDPANRTPSTWEIMYPAGYGEHEVKAIKARTRSRLAWANRLAPGFKQIHPIAAELPQECIAITAQVFQSIQFHTTHNVPGYQDWLENQDQQLAYRFHQRLLGHLQQRRPGTRWVLKAPGHLFALPALLQQYPGARIVQTHRDPLTVMASMASHATVLRAAFSNHVQANEVAADWVDRWARALQRFLAERDRANPHQFLDVRYQDIEQHPLDVVAAIYDFLGWPLTPKARGVMESFLAANPKDKHGTHRYSLAQYGLDAETELKRFRDYCDRFSIQPAAR